LRLPPLTAWTVFVLSFPFFGVTFWLRFRSGRWRGHNLVDARPLTPAAGTDAPADL
jgi:hypothetical protein